MNRIIRWYNQYRKEIWIAILTIIGIIALIQTLNNYYKNNPKKESSSANNSTTTYNTNNYSVVTQKKIDENIAMQSNAIIDTFFNYCNSGQFEEAYNMLSSGCRKELFPEINDFIKYQKRIFTEKKMYNSTLWITTNTRNTYRLEITGDILAAGKTEDMPIEEYYTIVKENGENKLNVCKFIGQDEINISKEQNGVNIDILTRDLYIDYEIYEIKITNKTGSTLIFNTKENTDSIYIKDENGLEYIAFLNEIHKSKFEILNGTETTLEIKFNRGYKPDTKIEKIIFEDIKINNNEQTEVIEVEI